MDHMTNIYSNAAYMLKPTRNVFIEPLWLNCVLTGHTQEVFQEVFQEVILQGFQY